MTEQDKQALIKHFCSRDCGEAAENCEIMPCWEIELIQEFQTTDTDSDTISRQAAIDALNNIEIPRNASWYQYYQQALTAVDKLPPAQLSTNLAEVGTDCISRQAAIEGINKLMEIHFDRKIVLKKARDVVEQLPPAQPERRCVNCGRTVNNGGWYEDGRTRCPIEEHYALPKDGYCHLWEKRKDWEDDYVKRAEEGEK